MCYEWLVKMAPDVAKRFGLQTLRDRDLVLLSEWLEGGHYKSNDRRLPWIWTLRLPVDSADEAFDNTLFAQPSASATSTASASLEEVVETWRNECERTLRLRCVLTVFDSALLHAFSVIQLDSMYMPPLLRNAGAKR